MSDDPKLECGICESGNIHIYSEPDEEGITAVCLSCGSHYSDDLGWIESEDL